MTPYKAYKISKAMALHFSNESYSVLKYGTNNKAFAASFDKLTESQKYRYNWLSSKFSLDQDLVYCCIANYMEGVNLQYGDKQEIYDNFLSIKGRREGINFYITEDYNKWVEDRTTFQETFFKYMVKEYSPEFILCLSDIQNNALGDMYINETYSFARTDILRLIKYKDFFNTKKYVETIFSKDYEYTEQTL